ncbi:MAG: hypothetical protein J6J58_07255 [Oscillospiraceae bacterium]|nr:hypothetical protein [Oscillospiraceae bacterium]MBQ5325229.1 hypothetical protein [Oscillospiraceae bacterium]
MKITTRKNAKADYSTHDMSVENYNIAGNNLEIKFTPGLIKITPPCDIVDGHIELESVDWDCSYAYVINLESKDWDFTGKKYRLDDFIEKFNGRKFNILDECHGTNIIKLSGYLSEGDRVNECIVEVVYMGNLKYYTSK